MTLRLNGSTSGYTEIDAPAVAGNNTLLLPTGNGTNGQVLSTNGSGALSWTPPGKILQVVSATKTDTFSSASTSFADITGLSVSITPASSTSKIIVMCALHGAVNGAANTANYRLVRGSTAIAVGDAASSRTQSTSGVTYQADVNRLDNYSFHYLDSPSTTSSTTYKIQVITSASTVYINRTYADTDSALWPRTVSTITVMEIAA